MKILFLLKKKIDPKKNDKWILVTSAFHLKRAIHVGEKLEWEFIPYPTDYKQPKKFKWREPANFLGNLQNFQHSSHEWIGIISYYLMGRSSQIF